MHFNNKQKSTLIDMVKWFELHEIKLGFVELFFLEDLGKYEDSKFLH